MFRLPKPATKNHDCRRVPFEHMGFIFDAYTIGTCRNPAKQWEENYLYLLLWTFLNLHYPLVVSSVSWHKSHVPFFTSKRPFPVKLPGLKPANLGDSGHQHLSERCHGSESFDSISGGTDHGMYSIGSSDGYLVRIAHLDVPGK